MSTNLLDPSTNLINAKNHLSRSDFIKELRGPYNIIKPLNVSPAQYVPTHIQRPPYVIMDGVENAPDAIQIKNATEIEGIAASCSIARQVLNALKKFIRVDISTIFFLIFQKVSKTPLQLISYLFLCL